MKISIRGVRNSIQIAVRREKFLPPTNWADDLFGKQFIVPRYHGRRFPQADEWNSRKNINTLRYELNKRSK